MNTAIITISDSRTRASDASGDTLAGLLADAGAVVVERVIISDDIEGIRSTLVSLAMREDVDVILTTGGTGFGPRDNTPEATMSVIEREAPGLAEAMRRETAVKTPMAMLSRGICGIRDSTLIINLPGSPKAVEECFAIIRPVLRHAVELMNGEIKHEN